MITGGAGPPDTQRASHVGTWCEDHYTGGGGGEKGNKLVTKKSVTA